MANGANRLPTSYKRAAETGLWSVTGGVGLHGLRCGGFDATPGGSRVRGVCAFEYDCNPAAPPSGPGSLAGREAAARTALRKTHIERTTHHTHHAPRTHPPLSKRLLCPAKRVALSLPRRTHARRAKVVALAPLEVWAASPPSERRAAPQGSGARGLGLRGSARSCTQSGNVCVKLQSLSNLHFRPQRRCTRADCMRVSRQRAPRASGGSFAARFRPQSQQGASSTPSPPAMGRGARRVGRGAVGGGRQPRGSAPERPRLARRAQRALARHRQSCPAPRRGVGGWHDLAAPRSKRKAVRRLGAVVGRRGAVVLDPRAWRRPLPQGRARAAQAARVP